MGEKAQDIIWATPHRGIAYVNDASKGHLISGYAKYVRADIADELAGALRSILDEETVLVHVGYDNGAGGGNYIYADAVRTDSDAFAKARAALSRHGEGK